MIVKNEGFDKILDQLPRRLSLSLFTVDDDIKKKTDEIRIRAERPLTLTVDGKTLFIENNGRTTTVPKDPLCATSDDMREICRIFCGNSIYLHTEQLSHGFLSLKNGNRAGIGGKITDSGCEEISSFNIRIARQIIGAADFLTENMPTPGILIAGPPSSGKTTILRDLARQLSTGTKGEIKRVCVIDQRGEIAALYGGVPMCDVGLADVVCTNKKSDGIEAALRSLSPEIIIFDEIGSSDELRLIKESLSAGVDIITTAHCGGEEDLLKRPVILSLLKLGAISSVVLLSGPHGNKHRILDIKEIL